MNQKALGAWCLAAGRVGSVTLGGIYHRDVVVSIVSYVQAVGEGVDRNSERPLTGVHGGDHGSATCREMSAIAGVCVDHRQTADEPAVGAELVVVTVHVRDVERVGGPVQRLHVWALSHRHRAGGQCTATGKVGSVTPAAIDDRHGALRDGAPPGKLALWLAT